MKANQYLCSATVRPGFRLGIWLAPVAAAVLAIGGQTEIHALEPLQADGPVKVEILHTNGGYQLSVDHRPFYIKGAGLELGSQEQLVENGGNSFRTWRTDDARLSGREILDKARRNGLYVTMGLEMGHERLGFNYSNPAAVATQLEKVRAQVLKYKDSPALIIWAIGNELNLDAKNPAVWDAVNQVSKMIHEVDPNHLTTTPLAGFDLDTVRQVKTRATDLDLLAFQMYASIVSLPRDLRESGWTGPYMVTEWGATGHWEVKKTSWGAPIENDSTTKANSYLKRYETVIAADQKQCVGSYVFLWGHKQERTPTWYGMFLDSGEATAAVDAMHYVWTGSWPAVRSPQLEGFWLDGKTAYQNIRLKPGASYSARIRASDDRHTPLTYKWEVLPESTDLKTGGDHENRPRSLPDLLQNTGAGESVLHAPTQPGGYRLFAYVFDGQGHAAHANIPFYVQ